MDAKQYFEEHKDKIRETAEFLCKDDVYKVDEKFEELKNQYINEDGTHHSETITINNQSLDIVNWLNRIRHEAVENFVIIALGGSQPAIIYQSTGDQFSNYNLTDEGIRNAIGQLVLKGISNIGLYIYHNHPFIYRASPSPADFDTLDAIYVAINEIENNAKEIQIDCHITLIDFSIVTDFDYWSVKQMKL
jgi:hypothetical protein